MRSRYGRKSQQSAATRHIGFFYKCTQLILRIAQLYALPHQYQWSSGIVYQFGSLLKRFLVRVRFRIITADKVKLHRFIIHHLHLRILGKIQNDWAGASAFSYIESTCYGPGHIFRTTDLVTPFSYRLSHAHQIHLLKSIRAQERGPHLSGNHHDRSAVNHGIGNAGNGICRTGTASHQTDTNLTGYTGKSLCCMGSSLFMTDQYMVQCIPMMI